MIFHCTPYRYLVLYLHSTDSQMSGSHNLSEDSYNLSIHVIHGNLNGYLSTLLPPKKDTYLTNKKQNKTLELCLVIASTNRCLELQNHGFPLHVTVDVKS